MFSLYQKCGKCGRRAAICTKSGWVHSRGAGGNVEAWVADTGPLGSSRNLNSYAKPHVQAKNWNHQKINECERQSHEAEKCSPRSLLRRAIDRKPLVRTVANQRSANSRKGGRRVRRRFFGPAPVLPSPKSPAVVLSFTITGIRTETSARKQKPKWDVRRCNDGCYPAAWANISRAKR